MPTKTYQNPNPPDESSMHSLIARLKSHFGAHHVEVQNDNRHVTVHVHDDGVFPGIDDAMNTAGYLTPGMSIE